MDILSKFPERLLEHMEECRINAPELAQKLNINRSNVTRYLKGTRYPTYNVFIKMLNFFNCSADYLLGLVNYSTEQTFHPIAEPFGPRLREIMTFYKISQYQIEKEIGISGSSIYDWLNDKTLPSSVSLARLAKYMDCSVDYILGRIR